MPVFNHVACELHLCMAELCGNVNAWIIFWCFSLCEHCEIPRNSDLGLIVYVGEDVELLTQIIVTI
jgi:hypothetical protein